MDLFSRIAAQQGGQAPVLRPVLPPRFAPQGTVAQAQGGDMDTPVRAAHTHESHDRKTGAAGDSDAGPAQADVPQAQRARGTADQDSLRSLAAPTSPHAAHPTAPAPVHLAVPAAQSALHTSLPQRVGSAAKSTADAVAPDTHQASQPAAQREGPLSRVQSALTAATSRLAPKPPLSAARVQALSPAQPGPAPAAPVVHVHIDRIELRTPAAAPARAAPAHAVRTPPQRSLSEYLRSGGNS